MIYSNDETDKVIRKKNFILSVYVIPTSIVLIILIALIIIGINIDYSNRDYMSGLGGIGGFALAFGMILSAVNKSKWLKMPDGSYHHLNGLKVSPTSAKPEPNEYDYEYYISKKSLITPLLLGGFVFVCGLTLAITTKTVVMPIILMIMGASNALPGIIGFKNRAIPRLKLSKNGLWTQHLGFINWNDIIKTKIVEIAGRNKRTILEIYLKGTVFAEADKPDQSLIITSIEGKEYIEIAIDSFISKRNASEA